MSTTDRPILEVSDLHVRFVSKEGDVNAVNGVTFEVGANETLGIIGESGCGKSVTALTILNILSRNARIRGGKVIYNSSRESVTITDEPRESAAMNHIRRNEISMIFQEPMTSFSPVHTIGNQIIESIAMTDEAKGIPKSHRKSELREQALRSIARVGLTDADILSAYPHNLSGGMRQRAMIAMAIACTPKLLIADEPTTALDVTLQAQALNLIAEMQRNLDMSVVFITHDLGVVAEVTDRVVVMYLGRVVEIAPVRELFHNPQHPYTAALLESIPKLTGPIESLVPISGMVPTPYNLPGGCPFHTRCKEMVRGRCDVETPPFVEVAEGHSVSCLLREKTAT